jgi:hypothetical protein
MLRPTMDTLFGDDVRAPLAPADPPRVGAIARRAPTRAAGLTAPTAQLREAFPWDEAPRYLIHDRDHAVDSVRATAKGMRIEEVLTAPRGRGKIHSSSDLWDPLVVSVSIS